MMPLKKLAGDAALHAAGSHVRAEQDMGHREGFRNVSRKWLRDGTMSYEAGLDLLEKGRAETEDVVCTVLDMTPAVGDGDRFTLRFRDGREFVPTPHAVVQLGQWANTGSWYVQSLLKPITDYKNEPVANRDRQDVETLVQVIANGLRRIDPTKNFLWRTRKDGTLRAMLSTEYAKVDNRWFLERLSELIPGGLLSHWKGDSDTLWGNVLIPDLIREESDSDYGGMLSVGNSEIGMRNLYTLPSIFRAICQNGCVWGQKKGDGIRVVHRGAIDLTKLAGDIAENLKEQIPLLPTGIDRLLKTRSMTWDGESILPLFAEVAREHAISKKMATNLLRHYNVERQVAGDTAKSLFGVIASVTRAGQDGDPSQWFLFDQIGGRLSLYSVDDWTSLVRRAKAMKRDKAESAFELAA